MNNICVLDRSVLEVSGLDAKNFLQSIISNDINLVGGTSGEGRAIYTYFLNPQGRFLFDAFIVSDKDSFLLDVDKQNADKLLHRLNFYKLKSNVVIKKRDDLCVIYSKTPPSLGLSYKDPRYEKMGYRGIFQRYDTINEVILNSNDVILNLLKSPLIDSNEMLKQVQHDKYSSQENPYLTDKYKYSIPDGFIDLTPEKSLPPEFSCEELSSVSYSKGCYTGQEVISRTKYQGQVRKSLYKLIFDSPIDENLTGLEVIQNEEKIGVVTSNWKNLGIALLRTENVDVKDKALVSNNLCTIEETDWNKAKRTS